MFNKKQEIKLSDGKSHHLDVSKREDTFFAFKNLYAMEDHCLSSYEILMREENKEKAEMHLQVAKILREIRSKLYPILIKEEAENLCITKHSSGGVMGLQELANRFSKEGDLITAKEYYDDAMKVQKCMMILNEWDKEL